MALVSQVSPEMVAQIKDLIDSGDVDLDERRAAFKAYEGRDMELSKDDLILAIAATDDDDEDLFVGNVKALEDERRRARGA